LFNAGKVYYFDSNLNVNQFLDDNAPQSSNWFYVTQVLGSLEDSSENGSVVLYGNFVGNAEKVILISDGDGFTAIKSSDIGFTSIIDRASVKIDDNLYFIANNGLIYYINLKNP
jgi:hypothetical protein